MYLTYYFYNLLLKSNNNNNSNKFKNINLLKFKNFYKFTNLINNNNKKFYILYYAYLNNFNFILNIYLLVLLKYKYLNNDIFLIKNNFNIYVYDNITFLKFKYQNILNLNFSYFYRKNFNIFSNKIKFFITLNYFIKFSVVDFFKYLNNKALNNLNILFLRKNKVFNKGRYSRNRQYYRTGVYWCLYVNIIAVVGLYFWFYRFNMNFGYLWWIMYIFIFSIFFSRANSLNILNVKLLYNQIFASFIWFYNIIFNFFSFFFSFFFNLIRR